MLIDKLVDIIEQHGNFNVSGKCIDCGTDILIKIDSTEDGMIAIKDGAIYEPTEDLGYSDKYVYKCEECFKDDKVLHQVTEVYQRVVGYLRPIKQFNPGKLAEYKLRVPYKMSTI